MRCVVCEGPITAGTERYATAWESALRQRPCCGGACASRFDADVHWMPAEPPTPATSAESERLVEGARTRLAAGDRPRMIGRDLLLAGVAPETVRHLITMASVRSAARQRDARVASLMTLFTRIWVPRGEAEPIRAGEALEDLEAWRARFGGSRVG